MFRIKILLGGSDSSSTSTILEFDFTADSYTEVGNMLEARSLHAVSVVQYEEFSQLCP